MRHSHASAQFGPRTKGKTTMKQFAKIALAALMLTGATTAIATAPAQAQVGIGYGYYGGGYGGGVCDPRSRWYNPYRCDDSGYYGDGYYGYGGYGYGGPSLYLGFGGGYGGY